MPKETEKSIVDKIFLNNEIPKDSVLLVHSSFRILSRYGCKAENFIEELIQKISSGTLLMPTMTWRTVTPQNPVFDEIKTESHTGILGEIFRKKYSNARSLHPTHSVAGYGPLAGYLLSRHHLGDTPVPAQSPYGLLRDFPAFILMLGVGWESCTAIHHPEEIIAPEIYLEDFHESYELRNRFAEKVEFRLRRHKKLFRKFEKFSVLFTLSGSRRGNICGVDWTLIEAKKVIQVVSHALNCDPYATLDKNRRI